MVVAESQSVFAFVHECCDGSVGVAGVDFRLAIRLRVQIDACMATRDWIYAGLTEI